MKFLRRDLYYVYRLGCDRVITDANIYAKTLCTAFEIREYLDFLNATDKFGYSYIARRVSAYISTDGIKIKG